MTRYLPDFTHLQSYLPSIPSLSLTDAVCITLRTAALASAASRSRGFVSRFLPFLSETACLTTVAAADVIASTQFPASLDLADLKPGIGFTIAGTTPGDQTGYSVSDAGDINGDGIDDLVIGSPGDNGYKGGAFIVLGSPFIGNQNTLHRANLNGVNGFNINIAASPANDQVGYSVSNAGDVNHDGVSDLIIGAPGVSGSYRGTSYVVFGLPTIGLQGMITLSNLNGTNGFNITGVSIGDQSGVAVRGVGDMNHDGIDDLVIGAPNAHNGAGASYVVFGSSTIGNQGTLSLSNLNGANGFNITGISLNDWSGSAVSAAGDINHDGISDLIIGAFHTFPNQNGAGYVVFGASNFPSTLPVLRLNGTNGFNITGDAGDYCGASVGGIGDFNHDDIDDVAVSAPLYDAEIGAVYVVLGRDGIGNSGTVPASKVNITIFGSIPGERSGILSATDFNGDGIPDLIIGSGPYPYTDGVSKIRVVFGGSWVSSSATFALSDLNGANGFTINCVAYDHCRVVSKAGDLNHDGIPDIVIGAYNASNGAGAAYVIFGDIISYLTANTLAIRRGQRVLLNSGHLNATSVNTTRNPGIRFTFSNIHHGYFSLINAPNTPVASFIQQFIINGSVYFTHDDSIFAPTFSTQISDGKLASMLPQAANVIFPISKTPTFLTILNGGGGYQASVSQTHDGGYIVTGNNRLGDGNIHLSLTKFTAAGTLSWATTLGNGSDTWGESVQQTEDNEFILTGSARSSVGSSGVLLAKFFFNGTLSWAVTAGGYNGDGGVSVQQTREGGFIVAGTSSASFTATQDVLLAKFTSTGTLSWFNILNGGNDEYGRAVQQTQDSGFIVIGHTNSFGFGLGNVDVLLAKFFSNGTLSWVKTLGGMGVEVGMDVRQTQDGGFIITGYTNSFGSGSNDLLLAKFTAIGVLSWAKILRNGNDERGYSVHLAEDGGFIVTGFTNGFGAGDGDVLLAKFFPNGTLSWAKVLGTGGGEVSYAAQKTQDGGFVIAGGSNSGFLLAKLDKNGNIRNCHTPQLINPGVTDITDVVNITTPAPTVSAKNPTVLNWPVPAVPRALSQAMICFGKEATASESMTQRESFSQLRSSSLSFRISPSYSLSRSALQESRSSLKLTISSSPSASNLQRSHSSLKLTISLSKTTPTNTLELALLQASQNPLTHIISRDAVKIVSTTATTASVVLGMIALPTQVNTAVTLLRMSDYCANANNVEGDLDPTRYILSATINDAIISTTGLMAAIFATFLLTGYFQSQAKPNHLNRAHKILSRFLALMMSYYGPNVTEIATLSIAHFAVGNPAQAIAAMAAWGAVYTWIGYQVCHQLSQDGSSVFYLKPFYKPARDFAKKPIRTLVLIDMAASYLLATLSGIKPNPQSCGAVAGTMLIVATTYLGYVAGLRPYKSQIEQWLTTGAVFLQVMIAALNIATLHQNQLAKTLGTVEFAALCYVYCQMTILTTKQGMEWCQKRREIKLLQPSTEANALTLNNLLNIPKSEQVEIPILPLSDAEEAPGQESVSSSDTKEESPGQDSVSSLDIKNDTPDNHEELIISVAVDDRLLEPTSSDDHAESESDSPEPVVIPAEAMPVCEYRGNSLLLTQYGQFFSEKWLPQEEEAQNIVVLTN